MSFQARRRAWRKYMSPDWNNLVLPTSADRLEEFCIWMPPQEWTNQCVWATTSEHLKHAQPDALTTVSYENVPTRTFENLRNNRFWPLRTGSNKCSCEGPFPPSGTLAKLIQGIVQSAPSPPPSPTSMAWLQLSFPKETLGVNFTINHAICQLIETCWRHVQERLCVIDRMKNGVSPTC